MSKKKYLVVRFDVSINATLGYYDEPEATGRLEVLDPVAVFEDYGEANAFVVGKGEIDENSINGPSGYRIIDISDVPVAKKTKYCVIVAKSKVWSDNHHVSIVSVHDSSFSIEGAWLLLKSHGTDYKLRVFDTLLEAEKTISSVKSGDIRGSGLRYARCDAPFFDGIICSGEAKYDDHPAFEELQLT